MEFFLVILLFTKILFNSCLLSEVMQLFLQKLTHYFISGNVIQRLWHAFFFALFLFIYYLFLHFLNEFEKKKSSIFSMTLTAIKFQIVNFNKFNAFSIITENKRFDKTFSIIEFTTAKLSELNYCSWIIIELLYWTDVC